MSSCLYLMRHGIAVDVGEKGVICDRDRMLSDEGRQKTRSVARGLKNILDGKIGRIACSPYRRALETAEIVAECLDPGIAVEPVDEFSCGEEVQAQLHWLRKQPAETLLLVGHMPELACLTSSLIGGTHLLGMEFKKAGIVRLSFSGTFMPGHGCLEWFLPPSLLRKLE